MKFCFIREHAEEFPIRRMCRALDVSRSGYYAWLKRPESQRSQEDRRLKLQIRTIYRKSARRYGSPRVHAALRHQGMTCGQNRVARLMREDGLRARSKRKFKATTDSNHQHPVASNLLNREFHVSEPDTVWLGDITYIPTGEGWLYLAVLMDLASRRVVGWSMSDRIRRELTLDALESAVQSRQPRPGLVHHTDQGSQYACGDYQKALEGLGMQVSMSRRGNCWDNAPMESFFRSLKVELIFGHRFDTRVSAREAIFEYIEIFYNQERLHSSLGYVSPAEYERAV